LWFSFVFAPVSLAWFPPSFLSAFLCSLFHTNCLATNSIRLPFRRCLINQPFISVSKDDSHMRHLMKAFLAFQFLVNLQFDVNATIAIANRTIEFHREFVLSFLGLLFWGFSFAHYIIYINLCI
jgi:hypothetical protein